MINNFGESGFSVCHAGHCDWQRPHSVQVVISSRAFQVISFRSPRPKTSSSAGSSKLTSLPCDNMTGNAPSDGLLKSPVFLLKKILKNAKKRCHATPIVKLSEITMNHAIEITIFAVAQTLIASEVGLVCSRLCSAITQITIAKIVAST